MDNVAHKDVGMPLPEKDSPIEYMLVDRNKFCPILLYSVEYVRIICEKTLVLLELAGYRYLKSDMWYSVHHDPIKLIHTRDLPAYFNQQSDIDSFYHQFIEGYDIEAEVRRNMSNIRRPDDSHYKLIYNKCVAILSALGEW